MFGRQLVLDAEGEDGPGVASDVAILDIILDRLVGADGDDAREFLRLRRLITDVRVAGERGDFKAALAKARRLQRALANANDDYAAGGR